MTPRKLTPKDVTFIFELEAEDTPVRGKERRMKTYKDFRKLGWTASRAFRAAKIEAEWANAERQGLVKTEMVPDEEMFDDSYLETWGFGREKLAREKKKLWELIAREGVWGQVTSFRRDEDSPWQPGGSVWGIVGDPCEEYWIDLKAEALDALDKENEESARVLARRATFAGVSP